MDHPGDYWAKGEQAMNLKWKLHVFLCMYETQSGHIDFLLIRIAHKYRYTVTV